MDNENDKYYHGYIKYKQKYEALLRKKKMGKGQFGGSQKQVGCILKHKIENSDCVLMVHNNGEWTLPHDTMIGGKNDEATIFTRTTGINFPKLENTSEYDDGLNRFLIANIDHIDTNSFKSNKYAQNIGFFNMDMLRKYEYDPPIGSGNISEYTRNILSQVDKN